MDLLLRVCMQGRQCRRGANPGEAMADYILEEMSFSEDPNDEKWRDFPQFIVKSFTSNTFLMLRMIELS